MTIRVTVKNEDSGEDRIICAQQYDVDGDGGTSSAGYQPRLMKGGESHEFYVHSNNQIVVREHSVPE